MGDLAYKKEIEDNFQIMQNVLKKYLGLWRNKFFALEKYEVIDSRRQELLSYYKFSFNWSLKVINNIILEKNIDADSYEMIIKNFNEIKSQVKCYRFDCSRRLEYIEKRKFEMEKEYNAYINNIGRRNNYTEKERKYLLGLGDKIKDCGSSKSIAERQDISDSIKNCSEFIKFIDCKIVKYESVIKPFGNLEL